jgi:hypothetical protein
MARGTKSTRTNQGGLVEVGAGLFDMMASTARGVARGTLGLPGDIETIYDMGRSAVTGEPQRKNVVWNTEDWDKKLLPATPLSKLTGEDAVNPYDEIGTFGSVPVYGATARGMMKGTAKAFDAATGGKTSLSRRDFMKKGSAVAGAAVIGGGMAKVLGDLSKAPVAAPTKAGEKAAVKVATKEYKFNSLADYNKHLDARAMDEADIAHWERYGTAAEDNAEEVAKWKKHMAQMDEMEYNVAKQKATEGIYARPDGSFADKYGDPVFESDMERLDWFSPQAKAEMKQFKADWDSDEIARAYHWSEGIGSSTFKDVF